MRLLRINLLGLLYLIAGILVAATHHYLRNLHSLRLIGSALLAIVLWPLVLLGVDLHIHR
jgi:predicted transporter